MGQTLIDYYEILQVHPNASQEVIQNAYRALAKKYHPDLYPNKEEATKIMALINNAYSTLSDPQKRKLYNEQFSKKGDQQPQKNNTSTNEMTPEMRQFFAAKYRARANNETIIEKPAISLFTINGIGATFYGEEDFDIFSGSYITQYWLTFFYFPIFPLGKYRVIRREKTFLIISKIPFKKLLSDLAQMYWSKPFSLVAWCIIGLISLYNIFPHDIQPINFNYQPYANNQEQVPPPIPSFVPKNNIITQYVPNEPLANNNGHCRITVDNEQNNFPVVVRVWSTSSQPKPIRTFTIKQGEQFTAKNLSPGNYEIRYMHLYENIQSSDAFRTEPFLLSQNETPTGVNYDTIRFTLYKVPHGNAKTHPINVSEL